MVGPALGGVLGEIDPRLPFWVAAALSLANALYGLIVLPESLPRERRSAFSWQKANPVGALQLLRSQRQLWGLSWVAFFSNLAHVALPSLTVLYVGYRYGWDARAVGMLLAAVGVCSIIVQGVLVGRIVKLVGERRTIFVGLVCGAAGFVVQALAVDGAVYTAGIVVMSLWGLTGPALQGFMTRLVAGSEQGRLQGANSSVMGIANLLGPVLFTQIFASFIGAHRGWALRGAPFLLAAVLLIGAAVIAVRVTAVRTSQAAPHARQPLASINPTHPDP